MLVTLMIITTSLHSIPRTFFDIPAGAKNPYHAATRLKADNDAYRLRGIILRKHQGRDRCTGTEPDDTGNPDDSDQGFSSLKAVGLPR